MAETKVYDAADLGRAEWEYLHAISTKAFSSQLDRTPNEIGELVGGQVAFAASHNDPNILIGNRYNADQAYFRPRVAIATENGEAVGFAYAANNVSGASETVRELKRLSVVKNYLWLREVAVDPDHQKQGIAKQLGRVLLEDANKRQPVTAYIWPDEIDFLQEVLEHAGFSATGEQPVKIFGTDEETRQVRMQASSSGSVLEKLTS